MLLPTGLEMLELSTKAMMMRVRAGNAETEAMLARSLEALVKSRALLQMETPKVWHPDPQKRGVVSLCDSNEVRFPHSCGMLDPLILRSLIAVDENRKLREERRRLLKKQDDALLELRWAILESASIRAEIKAYREDRE